MRVTTGANQDKWWHSGAGADRVLVEKGSNGPVKISFYAGALMTECDVQYTSGAFKDLLQGGCTHRYYLAGMRVDQTRDIRDSKWDTTRKFPFGEDSLTSGAYTEDDHFASYRSAGSGAAVDYARNRSYAPTLGIFTSPDPWEASGGTGDPGSWNRFAYVEGDPIGFNDPSGLEACKTPSFTDMSCGTNPGAPGQFQATQRTAPGFSPVSPYNVYATICFGRFCREFLVNGSSGLGRLGTGEIAFGERRVGLYNAQTAYANSLRAAQEATYSSEEEFKEKIKAIYDSYKASVSALGLSLPGFEKFGENGQLLMQKLWNCSGSAFNVIGAVGGGLSGGLPSFALVDETMRTIDYVFGLLNRLGNQGRDLQSYQDLIGVANQILYGNGGTETRYSDLTSAVVQELKSAVGRHERALFSLCLEQ